MTESEPTAGGSESWPGRVVRALALAASFLTVVPVRLRGGPVSEADLAASRFAYPLVGGMIGLALAGLSLALARRGVAPGVSAFVLIASGAVLTGGLHLDGLADTADGLFLGGGPDRRLAVMRDPHVGSFGVAALILVLLGKYAVLGALSGPARAGAVFAAAMLGRTLVLVSAGFADYARPEGTGRSLIAATTPRDAVGGALIVLAVGGAAFGTAGLLASSAALGLAWSLTRVASRRLGGVTGDTLGALVELGELAVLLSLHLALDRHV